MADVGDVEELLLCDHALERSTAQVFSLSALNCCFLFSIVAAPLARVGTTACCSSLPAAAHCKLAANTYYFT